MSWLYKGISYCRQLAVRHSIQSKSDTAKQQSIGLLKSALSPVKSMPLRCCSSKSDETHFLASNYKFKVKSPYKNPKARRYGYSQELFDGGPLPRGLSEKITSVKPYRPKDSWAEKRALFGRNDYIDLLSDSDVKPVDLIKAPAWLKGFNGNELQRVVRRLSMEGHRLRQLYPTYFDQNVKRIRYLYKKYNQKRGKRHK